MKVHTILVGVTVVSYGDVLVIVPVVLKHRLYWCTTREHLLVFTTKSLLKYTVLVVIQFSRDRYVNHMTVQVL